MAIAVYTNYYTMINRKTTKKTAVDSTSLIFGFVHVFCLAEVYLIALNLF